MDFNEIDIPLLNERLALLLVDDQHFPEVSTTLDDDIEKTAAVLGKCVQPIQNFISFCHSHITDEGNLDISITHVRVGLIASHNSNSIVVLTP